jgi:hypothetical protein
MSLGISLALLNDTKAPGYVLPEIYLAAGSLFVNLDDTPVVDALLCWLGRLYLAAGTQSSDEAVSAFIESSLVQYASQLTKYRQPLTDAAPEEELTVESESARPRPKRRG